MTDVNREELSELLSGYLDGELNDDDVAVVERVLLKDQGARKLLEELRQMVHIVGALPRHDAPASIAEDIAAHLERSELLGDTDALESVAGPKGRSPWSTLLSMAAGIAVVATGVLWYTYDPSVELPGQAVVSTHKPAERVLRVETERASPDEVALKKTASLEATSVSGTDLQVDDSSGSTEADSKRRSSRLARKNHAREFAGSTDARSDLPAVPVNAIPRIDQKKLLAAANVQQILAADGKVLHLRGHPFHNEKSQLAIAVRDREESGEFARRLVGALRSRNVVNAARSTDETPLTEISKNGFFLQGASGVNYRDKHQEQILVYLTASDRDALLEEIGQWSEFPNEVELQVGSIRLRGELKSARDALAGIAVSGADELAPNAVEQELDESASTSGPSEGESTAEPGFGVPGFFDMLEVLVKAGDRHANGEDPTSEKKGRFGTVTVESKESGSRVLRPPVETRELPASPVIGGDQPQEKHVAGWKERAKAEGISGTGSLVESRMKDLRTKGKSRMPERRSAGQERGGEVGRATVPTRSADLRRNIEAQPEQFVTLVFQIIPERAAKGKASKRFGSAPLKKAKASNGRPRVRPKGDKKTKPISK